MPFSAIIANKKPMVMSNVVPMLPKITDHKRNGHNYFDWSKTVQLYLRRIDMDNHIVEVPPTNDSRQQWSREDDCPFLQIHNYIENVVIGLINHCKFLNYLDFL